MPRYPTRRLPPSEENAAGGRTAVEKYGMVQFGRNLQHFRIKAGFKSHSALARAVWGEIEVRGTGRKVARNRDRISCYEKGKSYPDPANLVKLCEVLGCTPEELAPGLTAAAVEREDLSWFAAEASGHPDKVLLKFMKLVSFGCMIKIGALVDAETRDDH
jgi:transcriptional regulator with XRE-family HTH domain